MTSTISANEPVQMFDRDFGSRSSQFQKMHASQLAEIAGWVAVHSEGLVYGNQEQPKMASSHYWTTSKLRVHRWISVLKVFEQDFENRQAGHDCWPALQIVAQEILVSEVLTRIWSATVLTHDWYHKSDELFGLAHSVHLSHLEAKNRANRLLLSNRSSNEVAFDRMNALRRRMERWTDLFLGQLPYGEAAIAFSFDRNRVMDFFDEQTATPNDDSSARRRILVASFSTDLTRDMIPQAANPDLNREIASGILACYPSDRFDSNGLPKSARMIWVEKAHNDAQWLMDQLVKL